MAMRTKDAIVCECGHTGYLHCKENDAPFSRMYEDYSLSGFEGGTLTITENDDRPPDLLLALEPKCPACGQAGKVKFAP